MEYRQKVCSCVSTTDVTMIIRCCCIDVLAGDLKSIVIICNALRTHFESSGKPRNTKPHKLLVYSTVEKEDMRVFTWVGQLTGREVTSYSAYVHV